MLLAPCSASYPPATHTHTHLPRSRSPWRPVQHRRNAARCLNVGTFNKCCIVFFISVHKQTTYTHMDGHTPPPHTHSGQTFSPGSARCALLLSHTKAAVEVSISHVWFSLHPGGKRVSTQQLSRLLKYCVVIGLFAKRVGPADLSSKREVFAPQDNPPPSPTQMRRSTSFRPPSPKRKSRRSKP